MLAEINQDTNLIEKSELVSFTLHSIKIWADRNNQKELKQLLKTHESAILGLICELMPSSSFMHGRYIKQEETAEKWHSVARNGAQA